MFDSSTTGGVSNIKPSDVLSGGRARRTYTKYKEMGGSRDGIFSSLDTSIIDSELRRQQGVFGDGVVRFQMVDLNGDVSKNKPFNMHGITYYPDQAGIYTMVDNKLCEKAFKLEQERQQHIAKIAVRCGASDEICAMILGVTMDALNAELGSGGNAWKGSAIDAPLRDSDGRPSTLTYIDHESIEYRRGLQKIRLAVINRQPIIAMDATDNADLKKKASGAVEDVEEAEGEAEAEDVV